MLAESPEAIIGNLFDFPIGKKREITSLDVIIDSLPEGLRAQSTKDNNQYYGLKENQSGELVINRLESWPANRVYSSLINGPTEID